MSEINKTDTLVIGVDIGGTFTDVTLLDTASGLAWCSKTPSTPADPSIGFRDAVAAILEQAPPGATVQRVLHGTTVATNLVLEGKGAPAALLTTAGFRYVLEIGRNDVPRGNSLFSWIKPRRPVAAEHVFEIPGRIGPDGAEVAPLDEDAIVRSAAEIERAGLNAVAIVFLHAYANPAHEKQAAAILGRLLPDLTISCSSEVLAVFREFERSMATILNVTVKPVMGAYVARLEERLAGLGIAAPLLLMKSSGGVTSARRVRSAPLETVLSGPAAGVVGAAAVGRAAGFADLIGIDIGGTSADISLIRGGMPELTTRGRIGEWPLSIPVLDIRTIGAGGGSIARVSAAGALAVGPDSAGADPGPACYGRGGVEPTVTDAHLVLGHLPPSLLGGSFALDPDAARRAIATRLAEPLGMAVEEAARGIIAIVDHRMVGAIRLVSVERGHDPRDFALLPFGGAGPLHGGALARLLGVRTIVLPPAPGVLSTLGLVLADLKAEFSRTVDYAGKRHDISRLGATFAALDREARQWLHDERVPAAAARVTWNAALRYRNQGFELDVPWQGVPSAGVPLPVEPVTEATLAATIDAFHALHERLYTFAQPDTPVEVVTLRVEASAAFPLQSPPELAESGATGEAIIGEVRLALPDGAVRAAIYDRALLAPGARVAGPAIVRQFDSTALLLPGQSGVVDSSRALVVSENG